MRWPPCVGCVPNFKFGSNDNLNEKFKLRRPILLHLWQSSLSSSSSELTGYSNNSTYISFTRMPEKVSKKHKETCGKSNILKYILIPVRLTKLLLTSPTYAGQRPDNEPSMVSSHYISSHLILPTVVVWFSVFCHWLDVFPVGWLDLEASHRRGIPGRCTT